MKLRLSNTWRVPYSDEEEIVETWELRELDLYNNPAENGLWESSDSKEVLLAIIEKLRTKHVEEFYEV